MLLGRMRPPGELEFRVAFSKLGLGNQGKLSKLVRLYLHKYEMEKIKYRRRIRIDSQEFYGDEGRKNKTELERTIQPLIRIMFF